jgi:hypothetical protein
MSVEKLRKRAEKRRCKSRAAADADLVAIDGLEKLQTWLKKRRITIFLTRAQAATYYDDTKHIEINTNCTRQKQLTYLLHECGHVLIGKRMRDERWGMTELIEGERCTFRHIVDVVDEEFEAWARAKKLAERLKITIDSVVWNKINTWALVSYIRWANKDRKYNDGDYESMRLPSVEDYVKSNKESV